MVTQLDSVPSSLDVARASVDAWALDFSPAMDDPETIVGADAVLVSTASIPNREVDGFVTMATVDGDAVVVEWTGATLIPGGSYVLHTRATLDTGAVLVLLTGVRCVG